MDAGQTSHGLREVAVGARKILRPQGNAHVPVEVAVAIAVQRAGRKHQAGEGPLGLLLPVGGMGMSPTAYSTPLNWRNGRWNAYNAPER